MTAGTVVIGGTGFLGSRLVERLAARGDDVLVLSRKGRWSWGDPPKGVRWLAIDIAQDAAGKELSAALSGARRIVNLAGALYRPSTPRETYRDLHVKGTRRVISAISGTGSAGSPTRVIHVSTTGVLGPTGKTPRGEDTPPAPSNEYERTKLEGERIALGARNARLHVAIARPGLVYGPRDLHLLAWFRSIADGRFRTIGGGNALWQPIHVDDVARGLEALVDAPEADGQIVQLAGAERVSVKDLADRIADELGVDRPVGSVPYPLALVAGIFFEALYAIQEGDPPISRSRVKTLTADRVYAIDRAERLLGFKPSIPLAEGLKGTIAWYRAQALLR